MPTGDPLEPRGAAPSDDELSRAVADHVRSLAVPPGLVEAGWRRRPAVRFAPDRGRPARRSFPVAAAAAVVVVALVAGAIWVGAQADRRTAASPSVPAPTAVATVLPSASQSYPSPTATATLAAPDLAGYAWFTASFDGGCPAGSAPEPLSGCSGSPTARAGSFELFVGTLDGRTTLHVVRTLPGSARLWVGRGSQSFAAGPFGGRVLYTLFDGSRTEVHVVDAATGRDDTRATVRAAVDGAVLDASTGALYLGELDASGRRDLGVWRLSPGSGAPVAVVAAAGHAYTGPQEWARGLFTSADGSRLLVRDCEDGSCTLRAYRTADGSQTASATLGGSSDVFGITGSEAVGLLGCRGDACSVGALDLDTGRVRTLTDDRCALSGYGVLAAEPDGTPVLLVPAFPGCGPDGTVLSVDFAGGGSKAIWSPPAADPSTGAVLTLAGQMPGVQGYDAPVGWMLVAPSSELWRTNQTGSLQSALVDLSGGETLEIAVQPSFGH
jgi:hypothetical protein